MLSPCLFFRIGNLFCAALFVKLSTTFYALVNRYIVSISAVAVIQH